MRSIFYFDLKISTQDFNSHASNEIAVITIRDIAVHVKQQLESLGYIVSTGSRITLKERRSK